MREVIHKLIEMTECKDIAVTTSNPLFAILLSSLYNQSMREVKAFKTYEDFAKRAVPHFKIKNKNLENIGGFKP